MSFNVQLPDIEGSLCLLEWINSQRMERHIRGHLLSFQKVLEQGSIYQILSTIDPTVFDSLEYGTRNKKIEAIQKYIDRQFGKRMRWSFKQSLGDFTELNNLKQLTKLTCYLGVHSNKKNDFINRILKLTQKTQNYLMNQMQIMEQKLENIMEIKQILEQIEFLEQQNEELKQKLQEMAKANSDLLMLVKDTQTQNRNLKQQAKKYRQQKWQVLSALKIDYISQYLDMYNRLQRQNEENLDNLKQVETKLEENQNHSKQLKERIKADCLVINSLSEEISRLKQVCSENSVRLSFENMLGSSNSNLLKSASSNKQNINKSKCSTTIGKSLDVPYHSSEWNALTDNQDQLNEKQSIRVHNQELMGKLQEMYKKYNKLNGEAVELRNKNQKLGKSYLRIRDVLKAVENAQNEFEFKYQAASNQYRLTINGGMRRCA